MTLDCVAIGMGAVNAAFAAPVCWSRFLHRLWGWATIHKKCGPVSGMNSLDAEIAGCSMLIENWKKWVDKCVYVHQVSPWCLSPLCMVHLSLECFARKLTVTEPHTLASFCGCLVVCAGLWSWLRVVEGRAFRLFE